MEKLQIQHIPRDVFFNIFARLPIRCLARLRCVCKLMNDIIIDPLFQKLHFEQSTPEVYPLIFTYRNWHENIVSVNEMQLRRQKLRVAFTSIGHFVTSGPHEFVGTCNGLLCFSPSCLEEPLLICNPITGEHISVAKPTASPPLQSSATMFGFGFNPSTEEHKVVRMFCPTMFPNGRHENLDFRIMVEVYTLGSTDSWRDVRSFHHAPQGGQVYAEGALYWKIHARHGHRLEADHIMSFDLSTEEFTTIPHPSYPNELSIVELRGSPSAVTFSRRQMTVWVLKDGVSKEWEMGYHIPLAVPRGLDSKFPRLVCMWESDGVLVAWLQDRLFSRLQMNGTLQECWVSGFPTWLDWDVSCAYRATLFPLKSHYGDPPRSGNPPRYISDTELCSEASVHQVCTWKPVGKHDGIVQCFVKNSLLHD